jgi:hypothetical protein
MSERNNDETRIRRLLGEVEGGGGGRGPKGYINPLVDTGTNCIRRTR